MSIKRTAVKSVCLHLQPVEYAITSLLELKRAVCSSSQTKRQGKYNSACIHTHMHAHTGANCSVVPSTISKPQRVLIIYSHVSNLLIMVAKPCCNLTQTSHMPMTAKDMISTYAGQVFTIHDMNALNALITSKTPTKHLKLANVLSLSHLTI